MGKWKECELGDITTLHYGKALRTDRRTDGDIPVFSSAGLTGCHGESLVDSRGLIIGRKGTVGKVYLTDTPFWCIDTAYYILPDDSKYDFKYLYFLLKTLGLEELNEDSAVPRLNRDTAYQQSILLPSISEQKAIASVLSSLDDKIDLLHRQNKTLETMAETLFRQWFVEEALEDWVKKKLGNLLTITSSKRIFYKEYVTTGIPFYRSKEIIELHNSGNTRSELFITVERFEEIEKMFGAPKNGDILLTSVGTLGIPYRVKTNDKFYFKDGNLTWFKNFNGISSTIIYCWLKSSIGKEQSFPSPTSLEGCQWAPLALIYRIPCTGCLPEVLSCHALMYGGKIDQWWFFGTAIQEIVGVPRPNAVEAVWYAEGNSYPSTCS